MRTIALVLPNWIGDVVMATPAIRAIREAYPLARLIGVCRPYVADTLAGSPWLDEVLLLPREGPLQRGFWQAVEKLQSFRLNATVLFPNSLRSALLAQLAGSREILGFARYFRDPFLTRRLYPARGPRGKPKPRPIIDDYNKLAIELGTSDPGHRMELFTTAQDEAAAERLWQHFQLDRFPKIVGLNPGGAFGAAKHWPAAYFAEVARKLTATSNTGVLVLCGPTERDISREIAKLAASPKVLSLADSTLSLGLTKAIVRRLSLLVSTDSGPRHFAPAFQVPVVSLFGPTFIDWTRTYYPHEIHLQKQLPCGPCQQRVCPLQHHQCMTDLQPSEVLQAIEELSTPHPRMGLI